MRILFLAPHTAIWPHALPGALVADCLRQATSEVVYVTCGESLQDQCVNISVCGMGNRRLLAERAKIYKLPINAEID